MSAPETSLAAMGRARVYAAKMEDCRAQRDRWIRTAHERGASYRMIADGTGMSFQRVAQIVNAR